MVGIVAITASGRTGSNIAVRHGEFLQANGSVAINATGWMLWNYQLDRHILDDQSRRLTPRFTWHGFQFVEVFVGPHVQFDGDLAAVQAIKLHISIASTGNITFSDDAKSNGDGLLLNQLFEITRRTQLNNIAAYIPTDCPTREKHGWLGDAQVTAEEALYNYDMGSVYTHFTQLIGQSQSSSRYMPNFGFLTTRTGKVWQFGCRRLYRVDRGKGRYTH